MGLLDDAIREHLDLKRRRGADPAEIERAEREALGPVRRNREPDPDELVDEGDEAFIGSASDEPDEPIAADLIEQDEYDDEYPEPARSESGFAARSSAEPSAVRRRERELRDFAPDDDELFADDDGYDDDELAAPNEDPHATRVMRAADIPAPGDATAEYDVEEGRGHDDPSDDDDVLEETPEFLQDTPDHDRLWFEQRPPRDFDFDS